MNAFQIDALGQAIIHGKRVLWNPDSSTARVVVNVAPHAEEGGSDLCGIFSNGEYVALYNCSFSDFVVVIPLEV